jgi:hypothetical protein
MLSCGKWRRIYFHNLKHDRRLVLIVRAAMNFILNLLMASENFFAIWKEPYYLKVATKGILPAIDACSKVFHRSNHSFVDEFILNWSYTAGQTWWISNQGHWLSLWCLCFLLQISSLWIYRCFELMIIIMMESSL